MLHPAILRRRRMGGRSLASYAANGVIPALVADFENDFYAGTIESFADFTESGTSFDTAVGARRLVIPLDTATASLAAAKLPTVATNAQLLTNPTFATDLTGWTETGSTGVVTWDGGDAVIGNGDGVANTIFEQTFTTEVGKTYQIDVDLTQVAVYGVRCYINTTSFDSNFYFTESFTRTFVATGTSTTVKFYRNNGHSTSVTRVNRVSIREMPIPTICIAVEGEITYADTGTEDMFPYRVNVNGSNYARTRLSATGSTAGYLRVQQSATGSAVSTIVGANNAIPEGTNVPFSLAVRHGHLSMQAAYDGALMGAADVEILQLLDTTSATLELGSPITGTGITMRVKRLAVWTEDIGETGVKAASAPNPTQDVILVIGQSNAVGWTAYDTNGLHPANVRQYHNSNTVDHLMAKPSLPLVHESFVAGNMGLDITFAEDYLAAYPSAHLLYVPAAKGTTGFTANNWNKGDPEYENAVALVNAALANVHGATLKGILWVQGEDDAKAANSMSGAAYAAALDQMISDLRTDITGASSVPFVAGQIGTFLSGAAYPTATDINAAIAALPGRVSNTAYASSVGLTDDGGSLHYSGAAYRTLGSRMYTALASLL